MGLFSKRVFTEQSWAEGLVNAFEECVSETGETSKRERVRGEGRDETVDAQVNFEGYVASNNSGTVYI